MISGSIVALVTPMHEDGSVHWQDLEALVEWHIESGTTAIVPVGTTGESATIAVPEHCEIVDRVVRFANGRIPIIAGTGANATSEAIELTAAARDSGADACLLVTPYYNKPTQEGLFRHYEAIAEAVDIPQVLYNVPGRTACDMLPETVRRLSEIEQVVAIKEATGDISRTQEILELCGPEMIVYSGDDASACELMLTGAKGTISVTANVAPAQMAAVCKAAVAGNADEANALNEPLTALHDDLFLESNPIPVKWALMEMGKIGTGIRLPLTELSDPYHDKVRRAMRQAGVTAK
ncbi:MAG: 4-hydroxy-tetrahydrodipicolinate synthase [Gammaproteobacteria bacterium]|jgi:4-hydroxy-tetrahydrodipicolinate synthase|nr:4-hydroxy-tetrahydrodipicolinate synthase [Gammaproteobacteria bacterium]|tara:strand:- start:2525 stop:3406 length:882 start_codon:yes stop_codon:yes gene_type:complete